MNKNDVNLAGGKGASLGEMKRAGIPVPPGFVILSTAFEKFLEETDINVEIDAILHTVNHKKIHTVDDASENIKALILGAEMPRDIAEEIITSFKKLGTKYVAVRSSATAEDSASAAWAGQLESYLNTMEKNLLENVKKCWASLFTPRAIFYRFEKGLHKKEISVAVVVQKMVASEKSGIAFSVHPVTQDRNQLIIEAGFGLGEAIVSGQITPDSYVVEKKPRKILDVNVFEQKKSLVRAKNGTGNKWKELGKIGKEQVLSEKEILKLTETVLKIENHYGFPCDIEWAFEKGRFYIVQSRPITTLNAELTKDSRLFIKTSTRDFSLGFVEARYQGMVKTLNLISIDTPHQIFYFVVNNNGVVTSYLDPGIFSQIVDRLIAKIDSDKSFLPELYKNFRQSAVKLKAFWKKKYLISEKEQISFIKLFIETMSYSFLLTILPTINSLPQKIRDRSLKYRSDSDEICDFGDQLIKETAKHWLPGLADCKKSILLEELRTKMCPSIEKLRERDSYYIYTDKLITNAKLADFISQNKIEIEKDPPASDAAGVKGEIAYKGKVRGKVKVILLKEKINTVKEGDILVASMTTPLFIPAIKKAAGFVTDEGGITCHAAIIARELRKPCVIGTKVATQRLKDGDLVEVDADKGIVKILKRAGKTHLQKREAADYQRLFQVISGGITFLASDIFAQHYKTLECLLIGKDNNWTSYVPRKVIKRTLEEGLVIFGNTKKFESYKNGFGRYITSSAMFFEKVLRKNKLSKNDLKKFLNLASEIFKHYSKTEFFYMDKAYLFSRKKSGFVFRNNLKKMEVIKNQGREYLNKVLFGSGYVNQLFKKISSQFEIKEETLRTYKISEVFGLFNGKKIDEKSVTDRKNAFVMMSDGKKLSYFEGGEACELISEFFNEEATGGRELSGVAANGGIAKGKVKKIPPDYYFDFNKLKKIFEEMKKGDILVAETTSPELMPACKKAGAIITNQGGLLSHAAIVSREMNTPCVVGTGNATEILRDGDRVEVDGNLGMVKILQERIRSKKKRQRK